MTSTDILIMIAELVGGLAFFLYGMSVMSGGLEQMAGGGLERTLKKVTRNDVLSFSLGAGITIAIQSSSAMTVMLVGLVNSGIISFGETFGMIMGSHVGTTLTSWLLTLGGISGDNFFLTLLRPMTFAPILAFIGIVIRMLSKKEKRKTLGVILIGFAILMAGMDMMSESMNIFRTEGSKSFNSLISVFASPILAFLISTVFTGVIQSSAATVAIVQAIALSSVNTGDPLTYQVAIPLVIGANVGTCMTALISCFGTSRDAKRVVALHIYTNAIGGIVCIGLMYLVDIFYPEVLQNPISMLGVAVVHTLFNVINTIAFVPFKKAVLKLCEKTVRSDKSQVHTVFLDERLFNNTPLAISECHRLVVEMANYARDSLISSIALIEKFDEEKSDYIRECEMLTDKYEDKLGTYLLKLSHNGLSANDSQAVSRMLHSIGDFERIGDHALNIRNLAQEMKDKKISFSGDAINEINVISSAVSEILNITIDTFVNDDAEGATHVEPIEQVVDKLKHELKARHIDRLQKGDCTVELGFIFTDLLTNFERVSDHCSNVAVYTIKRNSEKLDTHTYLNKIKSSDDGDFIRDYNFYEAKYSVEQ